MIQFPFKPFGDLGSFTGVVKHIEAVDIKITRTIWIITRGLSAYTARSSFKVFSIATNACMWMLAKQGERRIKKVIKCIHFMQFAQHIYLLFWAKDHFHLSRRPDSLISYSRLCVVTKCTQQNIPYQRNYLITYSLFDHTWAVFISHYAWHLLMLVIICTKYRKL